MHMILPFFVPVASNIAWIALPAFARFSSRNENKNISYNTDKIFSNYYHLQSVHFEYIRNVNLTRTTEIEKTALT